MPKSNLKNFKDDIPYKNRQIISNLFGVMALLFLYILIYIFSVSLTIIFPYWIIPSISFIFFILLVVAIWFNPTPRERFLGSLDKLAERVEKNEKINQAYKKSMWELENLIDIKEFGFTKQVYENFFNYMRYVLISMLNSKNQSLRKEIIFFLRKLAETKDIHQFHLYFVSLHESLINYREFKDVYQVYNLQDKRNFIKPDPYNLILNLKAMAPPTKFQKIMIFLRENNLNWIIFVILILLFGRIFNIDVSSFASLFGK